MFLGEYKHQIDEKSRLRVPKAFKKALGKHFVVTKGTAGCLYVFTPDNVKTLLTDKLKETSLFDANIQKPIRALLSSAFEVTEDNQGRFLLPKALKQFASLSKDIIFIGVGTHIEIWDAKNWKNYLEGNENFDELLKGLKNYGI
jgi:MraZ protein